MKTYLSHDERQIVTYFAICYGMIDTFLEERSKNLSKEEITDLKYSRTYLSKYIQDMIKRVGEVEGDRIYRMARDNMAELRPKNYDGQLIVDKEVMIGTAEMALRANCFECNRVDYNNCSLCKFMDVLGVGSINDTKGLCEYRYDEK
jgi:hypothetical protein